MRIESDDGLEKRKEELEKLIIRHFDLISEREGWVSSLAMFMTTGFVYWFGGHEWLIHRIRLLSHESHYVKLLADIKNRVELRCHDVSVWKQDDERQVQKLVKHIKRHMRKAHYPIDHITSPLEVLESFDRFYPLADRMPASFSKSFNFFQMKSAASGQQVYRRFQHVVRFHYAYAQSAESAVDPSESWEDFLARMVAKALSTYPGPYSGDGFSLAEPASLLDAVQKSSRYMALARFSCDFLPFAPDFHGDASRRLDFIHFSGAPTPWYSWLEIIIMGFLFLQVIDFVESVINKICCKKDLVYYYPNSKVLHTRREIESAIHAVMKACDQDVTGSRFSKMMRAIFSLVMSLIAMDGSAYKGLFQLFMVIPVLYFIYNLYKAVAISCGKYSYLETQEDHEQLLQSLFTSFNQEVSIVDMDGRRGLSIGANDFSSVSKKTVAGVIAYSLRVLNIDFEQREGHFLLHRVDRISTEALRYLNILTFSKMDSHLIGQIIRSQLDGVLTKASIRRVDRDGAFDFFQITLQHATQKQVHSRAQHLGLEMMETRQDDGSADVTIQVSHVLNPMQLKLLRKIEQAWVDSYRASSGGSYQQQRTTGQRRRKGGGGSKSQQSVVMPRVERPLAAKIVIKWPCGVSWDSSVKTPQAVVPVRADIPLFLVLCGPGDPNDPKKEFPQGVFEMFQMIVQNGPAIVPAKGNSGVVPVSKTDEAFLVLKSKRKLKHVSTDWRMACRSERAFVDRSLLLIFDRVYQKGKASQAIGFPLPAPSPTR
jgi:hypothetical protein